MPRVIVALPVGRAWVVEFIGDLWGKRKERGRQDPVAKRWSGPGGKGQRSNDEGPLSTGACRCRGAMIHLLTSCSIACSCSPGALQSTDGLCAPITLRNPFHESVFAWFVVQPSMPGPGVPAGQHHGPGPGCAGHAHWRTRGNHRGRRRRGAGARQQWGECQRRADAPDPGACRDPGQYRGHQARQLYRLGGHAHGRRHPQGAGSACVSTAVGRYG